MNRCSAHYAGNGIQVFKLQKMFRARMLHSNARPLKTPPPLANEARFASVLESDDYFWPGVASKRKGLGKQNFEE
jgi:hypothetical protein